MNYLRLSLATLALSIGLCSGETIFVEAESFADQGGWSLDTQFVVGMGSPYLLAHGVGKPVVDAKTSINVASAADFHVWVRTKDWVAPWNAPGTPGRFRLVLNSRTIDAEFGTQGADWHWQEGGVVHLNAGLNNLALHDLTGFDGRCDAILFSSEQGYRPPDGPALAEARRRWLNLPSGPEDVGEFDLVVVGGGYSGLGAAISAARQSLKVALIQDRFVLGGNGSSEIRVWANGGTMRGKYPHIGEIVEEFADHAPDCPADPTYFVDDLKEKVCRNEKTLSLYLGHFMDGAEVDKAGGQIRSVTALDVRTGRERRFRGKFFVDCTGHGELGARAGAAYSMESKGRMGMSNLWFWQDEDSPQSWGPTPWALPLAIGDFPAQRKSKSIIEGKPFMKAEWFWESGFDKDPINGAELIRDWNLRAAYGAFTALKTGADKQKHINSALKWVAYVGGPRESRLLRGDVILSREDIVSGREFPDGCVATTWDIDLHYPKEQYAKRFPDNPFISRAEFGAGVDKHEGYPVPYRCFYSTNIPNLFMAGRCVSVTHQALGTIRVMRTCGMMGEVVGKAAYICVAENVSPRGVYEKHLPQLLELLNEPGAMRRDSLHGKLHRDTTINPVTPFFRKESDPQSLAARQTESERPAPQPKSPNLPGIVVDDSAATFSGKWTKANNLQPFIGEGYRYSKSADAKASYRFSVPKTGQYEVRLSWVGNDNRATNVLCQIENGGSAAIKLRLNQRQAGAGEQLFHPIGVFDFAQGKTNVVTLSTAGADGFVHADCLQVVEAKQ